MDGYHFAPDYQKAVKVNGYKLLVIDDMAHLNHYHADILLNQNIHAPSLRYSCDRDTEKLLGCEYVLRRREFLKYKSWKRKIPEKAKKILVTRGGADSKNVTLKIIKALNNLNNPDLEVKILSGPMNPNISSLEKELHLSPSVKNMPELIAWADLAVSAGGSTCWELALMGLPSLRTIVADNQAGIAKGLGEAGGAAVDLGLHKNISVNHWSRALKEILPDKNKRSCLSEQGQTLINGKGRKNIMRAMLVGPLKLRKAQENDCELLWQWANDPEVREAAFNSENISWEDHQTWFLDKQNDPDCIQYIALNRHDNPIGQIRFDAKDSVANIDYSIDKEFRGMGLGKMLLKRGIEHFCAQEEKPVKIQGLVKWKNTPSNRSFQDAGFLKIDEKHIDGDKSPTPPTHTIHQLLFFPTKKAG